MKQEYKLNKDGLCVVDVRVFTEVGEYCEKQNGGIVKALIDIANPSSFISPALLNRLGLSTKVLLDGAVVLEHTFIGVGLPAVWGDGALGLHPFILKTETSFDLLLGCDFLSNINFERRGKDGVFILSAL